MLIAANVRLAKEDYPHQVYRQHLQTALDPAKTPIVKHCTAGKARVGVGSATMLLALGVPRETIIEDYLLSNYNQISADTLKNAVASGKEISEEQLKMFEALAKVRAEYLQAFFDQIDEAYGGTEGYLKEALGLTEEELQQFQDLYLEVM